MPRFFTGYVYRVDGVTTTWIFTRTIPMLCYEYNVCIWDIVKKEEYIDIDFLEMLGHEMIDQICHILNENDQSHCDEVYQYLKQ